MQRVRCCRTAALYPTSCGTTGASSSIGEVPTAAAAASAAVCVAFVCAWLRGASFLIVRHTYMLSPLHTASVSR